MSLDSDDDHKCSTVDDKAYEPTYAEAFPPLSVVSDVVEPVPQQAGSNKWSAAAKMAVRSSIITQVKSRLRR